MKEFEFYDCLADLCYTVNATNFWSACQELYNDFGGFYFYNQIVYIGEETY